MNFADSVRFLHALGHELKVVKWDLERIETLLTALENPHRRGRFIHVAGTNGKGSTCAMIASALRVSGLRTGLYTSPHLVDPRERIQIDGELISEADWCAAFDEVHAAVESPAGAGPDRHAPKLFRDDDGDGIRGISRGFESRSWCWKPVSVEGSMRRMWSNRKLPSLRPSISITKHFSARASYRLRRRRPGL